MATNDMGALVVREGHSVIPNNSQIMDVQNLGHILAKSGYFADAREMAQAAVKVLAGAELGIPPIAAMMGIYVIKGKAVLGAHLVASRVRAHGYDFSVKRLDNTGCVLVFMGKPDDKGKRHPLGESAFMEEDAKAAGLLSNDTWKKFPRNMYYARAMSNGCKWFTPEVTSGMPVYTPEEMGATVDGDGDIIPNQERPVSIAEKRVAEESAKLEDQRKAQQAAQTPETDIHGLQIEPEVLDAWQRMGAKADSVLAEFQRFKQQFIEACGPSAGEAEYYRVLGMSGRKKSNEFVRGPLASVQAARVCIREMWKALEAARQLGVSVEDDAPF